ncbi:MAG: PIN domain-containing protein [Bacteroidetes bacterium]|nr:PIN domain-containing protein [Bacteroidota bacterium]MBS1540140.1 PIN domain-containing protein [Bacteroidota bacterium]
MAYKIFLDTNLFLDHLLDRNNHSSTILKACEESVVTGFASSASFYTLAYLIRKTISTSATRKLLGEYLRFISILPTQKNTLRISLESSFNDLEDAFQYFTALEEKQIDFFITANLKDYQKVSQQLPVISPQKFVTEYLV